MQSLFEITRIRAFFDERLEQVHLLHCAAFGSTGVMKDVDWITGEGNLILYIVHAALFSLKINIADHESS